ncbi:CoA transferase [Streptosporangium sp. NBC_01755]|uniref:CoA transferase n=1 Tax=unclassified Streptosporangium TaxID=2632669 RepID=UPI002DDB106A|nr:MULTISPECIES: CoA transferase [unclassified Streptosporangium]WSA25543.1 CoA transferase [Streptosporangium sp. NBC_01810]WSD03069.1 CoA transferase [Streptosporangium sp. NBC_01755]
MNKDDLILISVDDHIAEPADMFHAHVPERYKDQALRVIIEENGVQQWYYGDLRGRNMGLNAVAGKPREMYNIDASSYDEMRPGCFNVDERVRDMNAGGQLAGLHAAFASIAAFEVRDATGVGMQVESTMVEAALNVAAEALLEASVNGRELRRDGNRGPGAGPQGVYRCAGDDEWVALALLDDDAWPALARLLGREDLAGRADLAHEPGRRASADELDEAIDSWIAHVEVGDAVDRLRAAGVATARVSPAADLLTDAQLTARGFWEPSAHPTTGEFLTAGLPFRLASVTEPWFRTPAPLLGQHNEEILTGILGMSEDEIRVLAEEKVIGTRPAGL